MIHFQFITQLYIKNKKLNAVDLWYELCKEYRRLSKIRWHGLKPYPLADFVSQFCAVMPDNILRRNLIDETMTKVNERLLTIKLEEVSSFLKLLRLFLSCYPAYLSKFDESIVQELAIVPYCLPITSKQIDQIVEISNHQRLTWLDYRWKTATHDLFQAMSDRILQPGKYSDSYLTYTAFSSLPNITSIKPSDDFIKQKLKQIDLGHTNSITGSYNILDYIIIWSDKISESTKDYLLSRILGYPKYRGEDYQSQSLYQRISALVLFHDVFTESLKKKAVLFLKKQAHSHHEHVRSNVAWSAMTYASTIKEMKLENHFIQLSLRILIESEPNKRWAVSVLTEFYNNTDEVTKKLIIQNLISLLSNSESATRNAAAKALITLAAHITQQDSDPIIDYLINKLKNGCHNYYVSANGSGTSNEEAFRFDLAKNLAHLFSEEKKRELVLVFLTELNKPHERVENDEEVHAANLKKGGLLYSLSQYHYLIPNDQKEQVYNALFFQLQNTFQMYYIPTIENILIPMGILESQAHVDKAMLALSNVPEQLSWASWNHNHFKVFELMDAWYEHSSQSIQAAIIDMYPTWIANMPNWLKSNMMTHTKRITTIYLKSLNLNAIQLTERLFHTKDYYSNMVEFLGQENDFYAIKIQELHDGSNEINTITHLMHNLNKMSDENMQLFIKIILVKLPDSQFIEYLFNDYSKSSMSDLRPWMSVEDLTLFKTILISHLTSLQPKVFKSVCFMIFKLLPEFRLEEIASIYGLLSSKLNDNDKDIRHSACVLTSHLLDYIPGEQHNNLVSALLKNIDLKEEDNETHIKERVKYLMFSMLAHLAISASENLRENILYDLVLRMLREDDRDIARCCILHIIPFLSDKQANYLFYGFIADKLTRIEDSPELHSYFFDLYSIMVQGTEDRVERFEKAKALQKYLLPDLTNMVVKY
ncbi:MAG: hypothetical protein P4M12_04855 [Gammaproteobacteria bacterium]|nr:hypothetical protein [Gammaproteobacteria bacterium]